MSTDLGAGVLALVVSHLQGRIHVDRVGLVQHAEGGEHQDAPHTCDQAADHALGPTEPERRHDSP